MYYTNASSDPQTTPGLRLEAGQPIKVLDSSDTRMVAGTEPGHDGGSDGGSILSKPVPSEQAGKDLFSGLTPLS